MCPPRPPFIYSGFSRPCPPIDLQGPGPPHPLLGPLPAPCVTHGAPKDLPVVVHVPAGFLRWTDGSRRVGNASDLYASLSLARRRPTSVAVQSQIGGWRGGGKSYHSSTAHTSPRSSLVPLPSRKAENAKRFLQR